MKKFGKWTRRGSMVTVLDVWGDGGGRGTSGTPTRGSTDDGGMVRGMDPGMDPGMDLGLGMEMEMALEMEDGRGMASSSEMESGGSSPSSSSRPTVRNGSRGSAVSDLQSRLSAVGFVPGPIDGIFGAQTDTAVRAFQRSRRLVADGIVGPVTWGALTTPAHHRGKPAPTSPAPSKPGRPRSGPAPSGAAGRIVAEAKKHIGFHEGPNNENPFSSYFNVPNVPWCAYFVSYVHTKVGIPMNMGSCDVLLDYLVDQGKFHTSVPAPGDIVVFDPDLGDHDPAEHVGIVESVTGSSSSRRVNTIEGNSSDGVNRRDYALGASNIVGYGRLSGFAAMRG